MNASCDRVDIDKQKTISQTLRFPYNARVYIMRASYDRIDYKLKQKMCGKVNKDITYIQFFHSTPLHFTLLHWTIQNIFLAANPTTAFLQEVSWPGKNNT